MSGSSVLKMTVAAVLVTLACGDDDPAGPATSFTAALSGTNEVPAVTTPATGTATLTVDGAQIDYTVTVTNLQNAAVAHIHVAPVAENGPVRLNLCGTGAPEPDCNSGTGTVVLATGSNGTVIGTPAMTFDELLTEIRAGRAYVNVHTSSPGCTPGNPGCNAGGEIRGQVVAN